MSNGPFASRPPTSSPLGKCDVRLETLVPEQAAEDAIVAARLSGYRSKSEWLRDLILNELYGRLRMLPQARGGGEPAE